jgi:hypothetical protein
VALKRLRGSTWVGWESASHCDPQALSYGGCFYAGEQKSPGLPNKRSSLGSLMPKGKTHEPHFRHPGLAI